MTIVSLCGHHYWIISPETTESSRLKWLDKACLSEKMNEGSVKVETQDGWEELKSELLLLWKLAWSESDSSSRVLIKFANFQRQPASQRFIVLELGNTEECAPFLSFLCRKHRCLLLNWSCFLRRTKVNVDCGNHKAFSPGLDLWTCMPRIIFIKSPEVEVNKMTCSAAWMCWPPHFDEMLWMTETGGFVAVIVILYIWGRNNGRCDFIKFSPRFALSNYCKLIGAHTLNTIDTKVGLKEAWTIRGFVSTVMWSMALWLLVCLQTSCVN